jgi:hypothetical protein
MISEHTLGDGEGGVGGRYSTVDGALQQNLLYLVLRETVAKGGADVHLQLIELAQCYQRGQGDATAGPAVQTRTAPDLSQGIACDEVLKVGGEISCALYGGVNVLVAQNLATEIPLLAVAIPAGVVICGSAPGMTRALESGLKQRLMEFIKSRSGEHQDGDGSIGQGG